METTAAGTSGATRSPRVLLAEDDAVNRELETIMLERLGYAVDAVADGAAAVTAAAAREYEAILLDCRMPVMDGYDATMAIREREQAGERVPIIGLTGLAEERDRRRCLEAGMDDQLTKPFALGDLEQALRRAASPGRAGADVLDPVMVEQLVALARMGSSELLQKLEASYTRDAPVRIEGARAAAVAGDADALAFHVHTLKGAAANLGAREVVAACEALEAAPEDAGPLALQPLVAELARSSARAQAALAELAASR